MFARLKFLFTGVTPEGYSLLSEDDYIVLHERIEYLESELKTIELRYTELSTRLVTANQILHNFVTETDIWNNSVEKVIGRIPDYCRETLQKARKYLHLPEPKPTSTE